MGKNAPMTSATPEHLDVVVDEYEQVGRRRDSLERAVREVFDLTPAGIVRALRLKRPIYTPTAAYGHFGRDEPEFSWEATDKVSALKDDAGMAPAR